MNSRLREAGGIFTVHGPADALSTVAASRAVGLQYEANPIIRNLLGLGELPAVLGMCFCVAVAAAAWPTAADSLEAPPAAAYACVAVGALVVLGNLVVAL
ncbi:hypothetical protein HRPV13_gp12 [Halorubrum pleomorphic virus 13]|nr:hypothetical protein HRPV13_gp12 [Halorubrum pleomorphic virus 13]